MQQADFKRFAALMNGMAKMYERELDTLVLDAYWLALRGWPLGDFEAAAAHLMQHSKWMPRPAEFTELQRAGEQTVAEAWNEAMRACSSWRNGHISVDDRTDRAVQAVGGYRALAMADIETQLPHLSRRFMEIYEELSDVDQARENVPQIAAPKVGNGRFAGMRQIGEVEFEP